MKTFLRLAAQRARLKESGHKVAPSSSPDETPPIPQTRTVARLESTSAPAGAVK